MKSFIQTVAIVAFLPACSDFLLWQEAESEITHVVEGTYEKREICNGKDDDGDGFVDEGFGDGDSDGIADCLDTEECDGLDNNGDGSVDEGFDYDSDGIADCFDSCPVYVDLENTSGLEDGTILHPYDTIQEGIDLHGTCDLVLVFQGVYYENVDFHGEEVTVRSISGPEITVIDGSETGSVVTFASGEGLGSVLHGFTVKNGLAEYGAGIYCDAASPTLMNNLVLENRTTGTSQGGGLFLRESDALVQGNTFSGNNAEYGGDEEGSDGGAVFIMDSSPVIQGNTFSGNRAGDGGAIDIIGTASMTVSILQGLFLENAASDNGTTPLTAGHGGAIWLRCHSCFVAISNSIFAGNSAVSGGAISIKNEAEFSIVNSTFAANEADYGAIHMNSSGSGEIINSILYGTAGNAFYFYGGNTPEICYGDVYGSTGSAYSGLSDLTGYCGNMAANPLFLDYTDDGDFEEDDFHLAPASPCIDSGDPAITDPDSTRSDMGAYGGPYGEW